MCVYVGMYVANITTPSQITYYTRTNEPHSTNHQVGGVGGGWRVIFPNANHAQTHAHTGVCAGIHAHDI